MEQNPSKMLLFQASVDRFNFFRFEQLHGHENDQFWNVAFWDKAQSIQLFAIWNEISAWK